MIDTTKSAPHKLLATSILARAGLVKEATDKTETIKAVSYADPVMRLWPIDNEEQIKEACVSVELQSATMAPSRYDRVAGMVNKAASLFGIYPDLIKIRRQVRQEMSELAKSASAVVTYADLEENLPINTRVATETSIKEFLAKRTKYAFNARQQIANALLKAAADHGVHVNADNLSKLEASAAVGYGLPENMARQLFFRGEKVAKILPQVGREIIEMATELATFDAGGNPDALREVCVKAASVMDTVDAEYGFRRAYGSELTMPEDVCFNMTQTKIASASRMFVKIAGETYSKEDLAQVPASILAFADAACVPAITKSGGTTIDADKFEHELTAGHLKSADHGLVGRVLRGFGVRSVSIPTVGRVADLMDETAHWHRIASAYGSPVRQELGNGMQFRLTHPQQATSALGVSI